MYSRQVNLMKIKTLILIFTLAITACGNTSTPTREPAIAPTLVPTQEQEQTPVVIPTRTQAPLKLPATEADVPRVTVENAKAALDSGKAIIVDVRSREAYDAGHIAGALYIPLADMENNPEKLGLDKDQWIITYCT